MLKSGERLEDVDTEAEQTKKFGKQLLSILRIQRRGINPLHPAR
jgi:hypothetical protein